MSISEDLKRGRENYQRRQSMRMKAPQRKTQNKILIELGSFTEFILSKFRVKQMGAAAPPKEALREKTRPYSDVVRRDINALLERVCSVFPKKEKRYDPLGASWRRGRFGSN